MIEKLLSITDVAEQLGGISVWTVRAWLSQGRLQRTKVGRRTMIRESELERFLNAGRGISRKQAEQESGQNSLAQPSRGQRKGN